MIHDSILFHNCGELVPEPYRQGLRLQRVPEAVRAGLETGGQRVIRNPVGVELRFVPLIPTKPVEVFLSAKYPTDVHLAHGDFLGGVDHCFRIDATPRAIPLVAHSRFRELTDAVPRGGRFSPEVFRLIFAGDGGPVYYHGVEDPVRPPSVDELPTETLLAYGTSITAGSHASVPNLHGFPPRLARALGCDLLNYGCPGAALLEPAIVDYMAQQNFTRAVLGLSVNMVASFGADEFGRRARHLLETLHAARPEAKMVAFSILPYYGDYDPALKDRIAAYRETLKEIVDDMGTQKIRCAHGPDLLDGLNGLNSDLLHPSDHGFETIAERLLPHFMEIL